MTSGGGSEDSFFDNLDLLNEIDAVSNKYLESKSSSSNGGWKCSRCTLVNDASHLSCSICHSPRIIIAQEIDLTLWECPQCTLKNQRHRVSCEACNFSRNGSSKASSSNHESWSNPRQPTPASQQWPIGYTKNPSKQKSTTGFEKVVKRDAKTTSKQKTIPAFEKEVEKDITVGQTDTTSDVTIGHDMAQVAPLDTLLIPHDEPALEVDPDAAKEWIYPTNYPIRDYQFSIVQRALMSNTLVSLPTGLGKTLIAAVVMYNFYRWYPDGKVIFMAPTKPLVTQQIEACHKIMGIPQDHTAELQGSVDPSRRRELWKKKRVFFCTPQIVSNDLVKGVVRPETFVCLVFDEAHRATKNYAYCQVMREALKKTAFFRVLALSATPGSTIETIQDVILNLKISTIQCKSADDPDVQKYTHCRQEEVIKCVPSNDMNEIQDLLAPCFTTCLNRLCDANVLYERDHTKLSSYKILMSRDTFRANTPPHLQGRAHYIEGDFGLLISLVSGANLLAGHGLGPFQNWLTTLQQANANGRISRNKEHLFKSECFQALCTRVKMKIGSSNTKTTDKNHPKLGKLKEVLAEHFTRYQNSGTSTRAIVFTQYRSSVNEIVGMLSQYAPLIKPHAFIGQGSAKGSSSSTDNASTEPSNTHKERGQTQKQQQETVEKFRQGTINLLVATCIAEEGLDIGEVDLIVSFDALTSPIRMIQRMGRTGRKRVGKVLILVTEGNEEKKLQRSIQTARRINKALTTNLQQFRFSSSPRMIPIHIFPKVVQHEMNITHWSLSQVGGRQKKQKGMRRQHQEQDIYQLSKSQANYCAQNYQSSSSSTSSSGRKIQYHLSRLPANDFELDQYYQIKSSKSTMAYTTVLQFIKKKKWESQYRQDDKMENRHHSNTSIRRVHSTQHTIQPIIVVDDSSQDEEELEEESKPQPQFLRVSPSLALFDNQDGTIEEIDTIEEEQERDVSPIIVVSSSDDERKPVLNHSGNYPAPPPFPGSEQTQLKQQLKTSPKKTTQKVSAVGRSTQQKTNSRTNKTPASTRAQSPLVSRLDQIMLQLQVSIDQEEQMSKLVTIRKSDTRINMDAPETQKDTPGEDRSSLPSPPNIDTLMSLMSTSSLSEVSDSLGVVQSPQCQALSAPRCTIPFHERSTNEPQKLVSSPQEASSSSSSSSSHSHHSRSSPAPAPADILSFDDSLSPSFAIPLPEVSLDIHHSVCPQSKSKMLSPNALDTRGSSSTFPDHSDVKVAAKEPSPQSCTPKRPTAALSSSSAVATPNRLLFSPSDLLPPSTQKKAPKKSFKRLKQPRSCLKQQEQQSSTILSPDSELHAAHPQAKRKRLALSKNDRRDAVRFKFIEDDVEVVRRQSKRKDGADDDNDSDEYNSVDDYDSDLDGFIVMTQSTPGGACGSQSSSVTSSSNHRNDSSIYARSLWQTTSQLNGLDEENDSEDFAAESQEEDSEDDSLSIKASQVHVGVGCSGCEALPIQGTRYVCWTCYQQKNPQNHPHFRTYDLCMFCYSSRMEIHPVHHSFRVWDPTTMSSMSKNTEDEKENTRPKPGLSVEQKQRMEENRQRALAKRKKGPALVLAAPPPLEPEIVIISDEEEAQEQDTRPDVNALGMLSHSNSRGLTFPPPSPTLIMVLHSRFETLESPPEWVQHLYQSAKVRIFFESHLVCHALLSLRIGVLVYTSMATFIRDYRLNTFHTTLSEMVESFPDTIVLLEFKSEQRDETTLASILMECTLIKGIRVIQTKTSDQTALFFIHALEQEQDHQSLNLEHWTLDQTLDDHHHHHSRTRVQSHVAFLRMIPGIHVGSAKAMIYAFRGQDLQYVLSLKPKELEARCPWLTSAICRRIYTFCIRKFHPIVL